MENSSEDTIEFNATMDTPVYQLQAKMAELYLSGGEGLEKDPSTAGMLYCNHFEFETMGKINQVLMLDIVN